MSKLVHDLNTASLHEQRSEALGRLRSAWDRIVDKYSHAFEDDDEIDLYAEEVVVNRGFVDAMDEIKIGSLNGYLATATVADDDNDTDDEERPLGRGKQTLAGNDVDDMLDDIFLRLVQASTVHVLSQSQTKARPRVIHKKSRYKRLPTTSDPDELLMDELLAVTDPTQHQLPSQPRNTSSRRPLATVEVVVPAPNESKALFAIEVVVPVCRPPGRAAAAAAVNRLRSTASEKPIARSAQSSTAPRKPGASASKAPRKLPNERPMAVHPLETKPAVISRRRKRFPATTNSDAPDELTMLLAPHHSPKRQRHRQKTSGIKGRRPLAKTAYQRKHTSDLPLLLSNDQEEDDELAKALL